MQELGIMFKRASCIGAAMDWYSITEIGTILKIVLSIGIILDWYSMAQVGTMFRRAFELEFSGDVWYNGSQYKVQNGVMVG